MTTILPVGCLVEILGDCTAHGMPLGSRGTLAEIIDGGLLYEVHFEDCGLCRFCEPADLKVIENQYTSSVGSVYKVGLPYDTSVEALSILSDLVAWSKYSEAANIQDIIVRAAKVLEANAAKQDGL